VPPCEEAIVPDIRQELQRLIALNEAEQRVREDIAHQKLLELFGDRLRHGLIDCLHDHDSDFRLMAIELLAECRIPSEEVINVLIERLTDNHRVVRVAAVELLRDIGNEAQSAIPALKRLLKERSEPFIRLSAAGAISKIASEDPAALPVILEGLNDPVGLHRSTACELIGDRRNKSAVLNLLPLLNDSELSVRFAAGVAVGKSLGQWFHAVAACMAMLTDSDWTTRCAGKECLLSTGRHAQQSLDMLEMVMVDARWEVRLDLEEVLAELRWQ
jgi:HEAT repeat protein